MEDSSVVKDEKRKSSSNECRICSASDNVSVDGSGNGSDKISAVDDSKQIGSGTVCPNVRARGSTVKRNKNKNNSGKKLKRWDKTWNLQRRAVLDDDTSDEVDRTADAPAGPGPCSTVAGSTDWLRIFSHHPHSFSCTYSHNLRHSWIHNQSHSSSHSSNQRGKENDKRKNRERRG